MALLKIYDDIMNESDAVGFFGDHQGAFTAKQLTEFLQTSTDEMIDGRLHCRGGSVIEGYTCHDLLQQSGKKITMTVEGLCASIATVLLLAAPKENRKIYPNARLMIHMPYIPEYTLADAYTADDLAKLSADLRAEETKLLDFYVNKTGASREELQLMMDAETELSAQESLRLGFVSQILPAMNNKQKEWKSKTNDKMENKELNAAIAKQDSILARLLKAVGLGPEAVNMTMTDATGAVLTIEREAGGPTVGDIASPDGTFTMEDGVVITVAGGTITEVKPAEQQMDAKDKEIADLKSELETLKGANAQAAAELATQLAEAKTVTTEAVALKTELAGLKSKFFPESRQSNIAEPPAPKESETQKLIKAKKAEIAARTK